MKIEINTDREYNKLFSAMETVLNHERKYAVALGWVSQAEADHESVICKLISEDPFLSAGRDAIIAYLDSFVVEITADQLRWLDEEAERIASVFCIKQGEDY